jgi:hypothetical protein
VSARARACVGLAFAFVVAFGFRPGVVTCGFRPGVVTCGFRPAGYACVTIVGASACVITVDRESGFGFVAVITRGGASFGTTGGTSAPVLRGGATPRVAAKMS